MKGELFCVFNACMSLPLFYLCSQVTIVGYFYPYAKQLFCVARRNGFEAVESFPVHFLHKNKTVAQCTIQLAQGKWSY